MMSNSNCEIETNAIRDARKVLAPFDAPARFRILQWLAAWADAEADEEDKRGDGKVRCVTLELDPFGRH